MHRFWCKESWMAFVRALGGAIRVSLLENQLFGLA